MTPVPLPQLTSLVERLPTPFVLIDEERRILGASSSAQELLGGDAVLDAAARTLGEPIAIDGATLLALPPAGEAQAVSQLAGEVAHEFNNLLGVIMNFTALAANELPVGSRVAEDLQEVLAAARRASDLTTNLMHLGAAGDGPGTAPTA